MPPERQKPHIPGVKEKPRKGNPLSFLRNPFIKPVKLTPIYGTGVPTSPDVSKNSGLDIKPNVLAITQTPPTKQETPLSRTAPPPTQEEARAANAGEYAPRGLTKRISDIARNHPVETGLAATAALIATAYTIPAIHEQVNSSVADWWKSIGDSIGAPSFEEKFPILLTKENFSPVSKEEERKLWESTKTVDLENHTFTIGFPVDQTTIDNSPNLRMNSYFDQNLVGGSPALIRVLEKLKEQGYKNVSQLSGFPKDAQIYYRYDSTMFDASIIKIAIAGEIEGGTFNPAYTNYRIILKDKRTGQIYEGGISVLYGKVLVDPAPYPKDHHPTYEDGTPIRPDQPIVQLTTDLQDWDGKGQVLPGQKGQIVIDSTGGGWNSLGEAISNAQNGIYNPENFFTTSFLAIPDTNTIATIQ